MSQCRRSAAENRMVRPSAFLIRVSEPHRVKDIDRCNMQFLVVADGLLADGSGRLVILVEFVPTESVRTNCGEGQPVQ